MKIVEEFSSKEEPLLTIAIPTYNRANYLDLCLKRIGEEIASLDEDQRRLVKVYVSDNASSDDTPDVIEHYQNTQGGIFSSVRNLENFGADLNISQCYASATTPYVWVFGDDDVMLPGGLLMVLEVLAPQEVDILYVGGYGFVDNYLKKPFLHGKHGISEFCDSLTFARKTNVMLTFLSALIIRSGVSLLPYSDLVKGSNLIQLAWVLPLLRDGNKFVIIEDSIFAAKAGNTGGYGLIEVFGNNLQKISMVILQDRHELVRAIQNGTIVNFFPVFISEFRRGSNSFDDKDMAAGLKKLFCRNWRYYVFLVPLIVLPLFLVKFYNFFIRVLRRLMNPILI